MHYFGINYENIARMYSSWAAMQQAELLHLKQNFKVSFGFSGESPVSIQVMSLDIGGLTG